MSTSRRLPDACTSASVVASGQGRCERELRCWRDANAAHAATIFSKFSAPHSTKARSWRMSPQPKVVNRYSRTGWPSVRDSILHFTPTSASWLNMVERLFRDITTERLRRGVFTSVPKLVDAINGTSLTITPPQVVHLDQARSRQPPLNFQTVWNIALAIHRDGLTPLILFQSPGARQIWFAD